MQHVWVPLLVLQEQEQSEGVHSTLSNLGLLPEVRTQLGQGNSHGSVMFGNLTSPCDQPACPVEQAVPPG